MKQTQKRAMNLRRDLGAGFAMAYVSIKNSLETVFSCRFLLLAYSVRFAKFEKETKSVEISVVR